LRTKQQEIENIREEKIRLQEELNRTLNDINDYQKRIDYYQQVIATMSVNQPAAVATQELKKPAVVSPAETRKPEVREIPTDRKIRQEKLRQEYYYSLSYYYKLRELGITPKERYDILTRIQRKYRELGELKEIEEELRKITHTPLDK
jgi:tetratricopeptide (TPR) repeat protein